MSPYRIGQLIRRFLVITLGWELLYVLVVDPEQLPSWPNNSKQHKLN